MSVGDGGSPVTAAVPRDETTADAPPVGRGGTARRIGRLLARGPLRPGQFDDARRIAQTPVLRALVAGGPGVTGAVLDAGSGRDGLYDAFLAEQRGVRSVAHVDLDPPAGDDRPGHTQHRASLTDLPFDDASFDSAVCFEVLEHIEDERRAATELARVVRPGGTALVSVPMPPAPFDPAHVREGYAPAQLDALLRDAGFTVLARGTCMYGLLRALIAVWRLQGRVVFGDPTVGYVPAGVVRLVAHLDRRLRLGRPWDLVVLAQRTDGR
ncbi:class I SAM-dependent methyltransferase [Patulibacter sp.]|uniref:class I SAM-dependent methyltransferase n=1 Tax=Patulibacter sp. TaxID=1912859 RepID=UPI002727D14C|nr:class I SAM-dependent methyltransferase [Patulibacter sp.]MDO9407667.1 class I SAM-dependent methyltransferase [Patulibacter sp.]